MPTLPPGTFDPAWNLLTGTNQGPGYHTRLPQGAPVHPIRDSIYHAVDLFAAGGQDERALALLEGVLAHQDHDPYAATFGIWPWYADEPLAAMGPPDWNWADFIGAQLAEILVRFPARLPADLRARTATALGDAAWSIFRRNVQPGYTNIAIMGAVVAAAAGELCGEPRLLAYGRRRLEVFLAHTEAVGTFTEYNSPTYTVVALEEVERALRLVRDPSVQAVAARLHAIAWTVIAEHWHPGSGEWAGPCSRAYHDRVSPVLAALLAHKTGAPAVGGATPPSWALLGPPCPPDLVPRFRALPAPEVEIRRRAAKGAEPARDTILTTWMDADACLGTVNRGTTWTQCRAVLGYWRVAGAAAAVLRVRLVKDGRDFASGILASAQRGPRALVALALASDQGDWHCHLDRPADGAFIASDLRLRVELQAAGARAAACGAGFTLAAGGRLAAVHPLADCRCDGVAAGWEATTGTDCAQVDLVLYRGAPRRLQLSALGTLRAGCALELRSAAPAAITAPQAHEADGQIRLSWDGLEVAQRTQAGPAAG